MEQTGKEIVQVVDLGFLESILPFLRCSKDTRNGTSTKLNSIQRVTGSEDRSPVIKRVKTYNRKELSLRLHLKRE